MKNFPKYSLFGLNKKNVEIFHWIPPSLGNRIFHSTNFSPSLPSLKILDSVTSLLITILISANFPTQNVFFFNSREENNLPPLLSSFGPSSPYVIDYGTVILNEYFNHWTQTRTLISLPRRLVFCFIDDLPQRRRRILVYPFRHIFWENFARMKYHRSTEDP